ncbi:LacI family DNA-binding transcriptional regulator [Microlunatus speluncae]|uniref:LacI family DNA-binding transcriptional regulator n=1 Tax=Microlunatus speluncae TaxID=2594267 RepID=UPI001375A25C|nr:GntR family transcriptional regulator [Microlunatus speluncae]
MPEPDAAAGPTRGAGYLAVIDWIHGQIASGQVPVGSRLPSIADIAAACGVGIKTARSAVERLAGQGVLRTRQGSGTVVITAPRGISDRYVATSSGRRLVGALVPNLTFYGEILSGVESVLSGRDGRLMVTCSHYEFRGECDELESLVSDGAEGILCSASLARWSGDPEFFDRLRQLPVPCVLIERRLPDGMFPRIPAVLTDLEQASFLATEHLIQIGRERIAAVLVGGRPGAEELTRGYRNALIAAGRTFDPALLITEPELTGVMAAEQLIERKADAAFVGGGLLAAATMTQLLHRRRRVPRDVAIAAYDAQGGDVADIPMTSVSPQRSAIGRLAADMLLDLLNHPRTAAVGEFRVHPTLIIRRSTIGTP